MISRHFDLDRHRGALLTSQSVFQIELSGYIVKGLQEFSGQIMKSDFGSSPGMKSTSGIILALQGPDSFAVILWDPKLRGRFQDRRRRPNL